MIRLTFLGTGTSTGIPLIGCNCATCQSTDAKDKRLRASALVETDTETLLIDAGPDFRQQLLRQPVTHIDGILITHDHYDHTAGLNDALNRFPAEVYAGVATVEGVPAHKMTHGRTLRFGNITGAVAVTPGHTPDSISLILPGMVFTGDALFSGSVGGTASRAHAERQLRAVQEHILSLPGDYQIHTGHGPSSTVFIERHYNPFFQ